MTTYFQNPNIATTEKFTHICKERLKQKFIRQWHNFIDIQGSKLRFYKKCKDSFAREPYLDNLNCFQLRKIVAKFRCSDHRLEIEVGRHKQIKVEGVYANYAKATWKLKFIFYKNVHCMRTFEQNI